MLILPFLLMLAHGGIQNASLSITWAFFSPFMALLYTQKKEAMLWLGAFFIIILTAVLIDPYIPHPELSYTFKKILFIIDSVAVFGGIYLLLEYFIYKTEDDVSNNISFLQSYKDAIDANLIVTKTDIDGNITFANQIFYDITGFTPNETLGKNHNLIRHPDTPDELYHDLWQTILAKKTWSGVIKNRKKDGSAYWVEATISPILDKDSNIVEFIAIRYDVTEVMQKQEELTRLLHTDALTGLRNRKALFRDKNQSKQHSLALINIDNFSQINNLYGEGFGDQVLIRFSQLLEHAIKAQQKCRVYRFGGDEFVVLSYERDPQVLYNNLEKLIEYIHTHPLHINDQKILLNISAGVSLEDNKDLIETASMALKLARREKKHIFFFDKSLSLNHEYENNLKWTKEIKQAIAEDRVTLHYQAIKDNKTDTITKYETLIRIIDTDGNIISPANFLEIAKRSRLYKELTKIVIEKSFSYFQDKKVHFSVNITVEDILDSEINSFILQSIEQYEVGPYLSFELVETESIEQFTEVEEFINNVKKYGCKISIDDFGTGYSNFEYLMRLQADYIKIDGSIIRNVVSDKKSALITSIIVSFAKEMGMVTIGEFVENEEIDNKLKELGVDKSQGYFIAKPQDKLDSEEDVTKSSEKNNEA